MIMNEELNVAGLPISFPKPASGSQLPTLAEWNQRYIEYVLNFTKGKKTAAARILGINRRTLYRRKKGKNGVTEMDMPMMDASLPAPTVSMQ
jgi:DNA-binding NtrC family response regulator